MPDMHLKMKPLESLDHGYLISSLYTYQAPNLRSTVCFKPPGDRALRSDLPRTIRDLVIVPIGLAPGSYASSPLAISHKGRQQHKQRPLKRSFRKNGPATEPLRGRFVRFSKPQKGIGRSVGSVSEVPPPQHLFVQARQRLRISKFISNPCDASGSASAKVKRRCSEAYRRSYHPPFAVSSRWCGLVRLVPGSPSRD